MSYITGKAQHPAVKFLKVLMVILVIAAIAGGYLYFHPKEWKKLTRGTPLEPPPTITNVYKWRDQNGEWQMTGSPPPAGTEYEIMKFSSDKNVVPSLPMEDK